MKRFIYFLLTAATTFFTTVNKIYAQDYLWATTLGKARFTFPVAIRKDNIDNLYLATFTDSVSTHIYTQVEKRNAGRQLLWQIQINGNAAIADVELNGLNHAVVTGYFKGNITVQGNILTSVAGDNTGFIFETDETGSLLWINVLNPLNARFEPVDLFITGNDVMYLTAENSGTGGLCSFYKLDAAGNIIKSEFTQTFDNRTFSHIIADTSGNVYISGTCGNFALFDNIPANADYSYQNILIKYDSSFNAQWLLTRNYITFDNSNRLSTDGKNLYWAFDDYANNSDTVKIQKINYEGQVLSTINTPLPQLFFPPFDYSVDRLGSSTYLMQAGVQKNIYRYDSSFNIVWQDTLNTQNSGFPIRNSLICYDSCFYMLGIYSAPTITLNSFTLANPNAGQNNASDVFAFKWGRPQAQATYTFTGNGNWSIQANWINYLVPPSILPGGSTIYVSSAPGDACILDISQFLSPGSSLIISAGANFVDAGNLTINGLNFPAVRICDQVWMAKNLDVATYRNGDTIPQITDSAQWVNATGGAWCYYNNDPATEAIYGKLYNFSAIEDARGLAPQGWHIPNNNEWDVLSTCLGEDAQAGGAMKEAGTTHWESPNTAATNSSGFSGLPGGTRIGGSFSDIGKLGLWWSSDGVEFGGGGHCRLSYNTGSASFYNIFDGGLSVRCVKD